MVAAEGLHETPPRASRWKPKASEIPREIDESVLLDGCGNLAVIRRMVLPLAKPGLVATAVLCFILAWNEFPLANIFTRRVAVTLPVGISKFITEKRILQGCIAAAATLATLPPVVLLLFFPRNLLRGLTFGATRGSTRGYGMTMEQAYDFRDESDALAAVLDGRAEADWDRPTLFKDWTANDVIRHLHFWNRGADLSLSDPDGFQDLRRRFRAAAAATSHRAAESSMMGGLGGPALLDDWRGLYREMAERWAEVDPRRRVPWVGPDMSARSSITARLMETWSHGQAIFDLFGIEREEHDRIRNVVFLGVNTYGWTWSVREREPPGPMPHLRLTAPSGAVWEFGEEDGENRIEGPAVAFAQVVAQTRNVADTDLRVTGPVAAQWMANAQCFAGPAETPPPPGARHPTRSDPG